MGSWHTTCEITNLPIYSDEKCIMIDFKDIEPGFCPANLLKTKVSRIVKGTYSDYGDLNEYRDEEYPGVDRRVESYLLRPKYIREDGIIPVTCRSFIKEDIWNKILQEFPEATWDGKSIKELKNDYELAKKKLEESPTDDKDSHIAALLEFYKTESRLGFYVPYECDFADEFMTVTSFMTSCRMTFSGIAYEGYCHTAIKAHDLRRKLMKDARDQIIKQIKEEWDDDFNENEDLYWDD